MLLYSGTTPEFIQATVHNAIAQRLAESFELHFRHKPSPNEFRSWQNSLRSFSDVLREGDLVDQGIILEYQLPLSSLRLDAILTGRDASRDRAVIVELKQWDASSFGSSDDLLKTWIGGNHRDVLHPSVQVNQYRRYLEDSQEVFHAGGTRSRWMHAPICTTIGQPSATHFSMPVPRLSDNSHQFSRVAT